MKFTFINPSLNDELDDVKGNASWPPLGLLYLATILKEHDVKVSVLDQPARGFTLEETVKWVEKEDPDILGFSTFSSSGRKAVLISKEVKTNNLDIPIVFGSHYATFNAERILGKYPWVDIVVKGEGENTVVDLVNCFKKGGELRDVLGITYRDEDNIVSTPDRPLIYDLDSLPFPDRNLLDDDYKSGIYGLNMAVKKFTSIISSRGCTHRCRFCSSQKMARSCWRPRSVENTLEELLYLVSEGYNQFSFADDSFTLNQKRVIRLCKRIREEKIDVDWGCEGRVDSHSYDMFREMAKAGCKIMYFGIESANQRILDYYNKKIKPYQSMRAVEKAKQAGIDIIVGSFIVGAPDETREEIMNTLQFAKKLQIDVPQYNILAVYPGMDIWYELIRKELLDEEEYWEIGGKVVDICPCPVSRQEIEEMIEKSLDGFFLRTGFIFKQLIRTLRSPYRMGILKNNLRQINYSRAKAIIRS